MKAGCSLHPLTYHPALQLSANLDCELQLSHFTILSPVHPSSLRGPLYLKGTEQSLEL